MRKLKRRENYISYQNELLEQIQERRYKKEVEERRQKLEQELEEQRLEKERRDMSNGYMNEK